MYTYIEFRLKPIITISNDNYIEKHNLDYDTNIDEKIILFNSKKLDLKIKEIVIKSLISPKFKKHLYKCIFEVPSIEYDDISQYLDGKIIDVNYDKLNNFFIVKCKLFISNNIPKNKYNNKKVLSEREYLKLMTKKNIINMIKEQLQHFYSSGGHYKNYKYKNYDIYINLLNINNFKVIKD